MLNNQKTIQLYYYPQMMFHFFIDYKTKVLAKDMGDRSKFVIPHE